MGEYGAHSDEVVPPCLKIGHVRAARTRMSRSREDRRARGSHCGPRRGILRRRCRSRPPRTSVVRRWCIGRPARLPHPPSRGRPHRTPSARPNRLWWSRIALPDRPQPRAQPAARRGRWSRWRRSARAQFKRGTEAVMPRAVPVAPARARWAGVANPGHRAPARPARWDRRLRALRRRVWRAHRVRRPDRRVRWGRLPGR